MPVIGTFSAVKDGYAGTIRTLTMNAKVRIVANDRKESEGAPDFRIMAGTAEIGAAWRKTKQGSDETYLRVKLDDPALPQPIWGALLETTEDGVARLLWRRDEKRRRAEPSRRTASQPDPRASHPAHRQQPVAGAVHVASASHRLRAAALRRRLLPLVSVPHHQRADRGRPDRRARLERRRSRLPDLGLLPGVRRRAAAPRRPARPLWAEDHPKRSAAARKRRRRSCSHWPTVCSA